MLLIFNWEKKGNKVKEQFLIFQMYQKHILYKTNLKAD